MENAAKQVLDTLFGRWRSRILYAGTRLGVFDAVTTDAPMSSAALARSSTSTSRCCTGCCARSRRSACSTRHAPRLPGHRVGALCMRTPRARCVISCCCGRAGALRDLGASARHGARGAAERFRPRVRRDGVRLCEGPRTLPDRLQACDVELLDRRSRNRWSMRCATSRSRRARMRATSAAAKGTCCAACCGDSSPTGVVFDLPEVIDGDADDWAQRMGVSARCSKAGGNMFDAVPAADAY